MNPNTLDNWIDEAIERHFTGNDPKFVADIEASVKRLHTKGNPPTLMYFDSEAAYEKFRATVSTSKQTRK